jgi:hypothetical protein
MHAHVACRFICPEPRQRALTYLKGWLCPIERKNGWQLADQARDTTPYEMPRLLASSQWDADVVRDDLAALCHRAVTRTRAAATGAGNRGILS